MTGAGRLFFEVQRSVCGRAWRDRLDERATARALSMTQRHGVSELLARILAGRNVEVEDVEAFLDPTVKRLMPDPDTLTDMPKAAGPVQRLAISRKHVCSILHPDVIGVKAVA